MAENESKSGFNLPWANVVALLAAAGGIFTLIPSLDTSRPPDPGGDSMGVFGDQTVDSRLWQDPFEEVLKDKKEHEGSGVENDLGNFVKSLAERKEDDPSLWALIVMLNSGPHADARERRLRTRTAVVEGLSSSGYAPRDSAHIGYLEVDWPRKAGELFKEKAAEAAPAPSLEPIAEKVEKEVLPFEWFERKREGVLQSTIVIYLEEDACRDWPFTRLAWLSNILKLGGETPGSERHIRTSVLGPATSTVLERMVVELGEFDAEHEAKKPEHQAKHALIRQQLQAMQIFCPTATASDGALLPEKTAAAKKETKEWQKIVAKANQEHQRRVAKGEPNLAPLNIARDYPAPASARVKDWVSRTVQATFAKEKLVFQRTIPTDGAIVWETLNELQRRGINPTQWIEDPKAPGHLMDGTAKQGCKESVAIISELDTYYGRALPIAFVEQCADAIFTDLSSKTMAEKAPWIHPFHYLRGLDGRLPGDEKEKKAGDTASKEEQKQTPGARPDGHDQTDSLLRLAEALASEDRTQRNRGEAGFRAIGILGSDVYDKLLILRALRPKFPGIVFFTNNLDAQLSQAEEWKAAHNLVVVSAFGLRLHDRWQQNIPPFRDGDQTSTYLSTLVASGEIPHEPLPGEPAPENTLNAIMDVPRVFEIGRNGATDLSLNALGAQPGTPFFGEVQVSDKDPNGAEIVRIHPLRTDLRQWWSASVLHSNMLGTWPVPVSLILGVIYLVTFAILFYRGAVAIRPLNAESEGPAKAKPRFLAWMEARYPTERIGGRQLHRICGMVIGAPWKRLNDWFTLSTLIVGLCGTVVAVLVVSLAYRAQWLAGEPFAWLSGFSVWPGVAIRIVGLFLGVHFVFKSYCRVLQSDSEILERFALGGSRTECEVAKVKDRRWVHTFVPWTVHYHIAVRPAPPDRALSFHEKSFDATELWCQYIWRGWWWYRLIRVSTLSVLFLFITWCIFTAFDSGLVDSPTRSRLSAAFDHGSMGLLFSTGVFLTLFVVDALWLNASFIRLFSGGFTRWPAGVVLRAAGFGTLSESEVAEELDIQLIATRTAAIGEFVLYPFVIVALLVVSRAPYFDNWGWTSGFVFVLAALLALTVAAALNLRTAAENARKGALARLRAARSTALAQPEMEKKVSLLDDSITRVAEVGEGAFAPLSEQPIIRALLFPAGGIGMWELARQVLGKF